uniref:Uncharacterized protein n=1 Tax=Brassica campestris TaxID=3711 RepID=A0A3P5ZE41_BRACM|nr:unnamed protein product [Brassica rapa]
MFKRCKKQMRHEQYTSFRILSLDPSFKKLSVEHTVSAYKRTKNRAILVDYYGKMVQPGSIRTTSSNETIQTLKSLFSDPKNIVFLVSGKDRKTLTEWFSSCDDLGLAAVAEIFACTVGQKQEKLNTIWMKRQNCQNA